MKTSKIVVIVLYTLVVAPIWYYLMYKILTLVNATELMWFLFWVYVPVGFICGIISKVVESNEE